MSRRRTSGGWQPASTVWSALELRMWRLPCLICLKVLEHVLICLLLGIDAGLCSLYGQRKDINDDESVALQAHMR